MLSGAKLALTGILDGSAGGRTDPAATLKFCFEPFIFLSEANCSE
jgi:hypothetical protein